MAHLPTPNIQNPRTPSHRMNPNYSHGQYKTRQTKRIEIPMSPIHHSSSKSSIPNLRFIPLRPPIKPILIIQTPRRLHHTGRNHPHFDRRTLHTTAVLLQRSPTLTHHSPIVTIYHSPILITHPPIRRPRPLSPKRPIAPNFNRLGRCAPLTTTTTTINPAILSRSIGATPILPA